MSEVLADECNIDRERERDLIKIRIADQFAAKSDRFELKIFWDIAGVVLNSVLDEIQLLRFSFDCNRHSRLDFKRSTVDFFAVHMDMPVRDKLLGSKNCRS